METDRFSPGPRPPAHTRADGVERVDFQLRRERRGSGFRPDGTGWYNTYGADFELRSDSGALFFAARR